MDDVCRRVLVLIHHQLHTAQAQSCSDTCRGWWDSSSIMGMDDDGQDASTASRTGYFGLG